MKIHDWYGGAYPARVRIAVAELGLRSEICFRSVSLKDGEHKRADFLAKNYSGTLPVLELDDGTFIAECTAITEYLDNIGPTRRLTGTTAREKGVIHMMNKRAEIEFLDALSVYFHHATPGLGPHVEVYQNLEWGLYMRDKAVGGAHYYNDVLKNQPFVAGKAFSMADITVVAGFIFANMLSVEIPAELKHLHQWHAAMLKRPSVQNWTKMSDPVQP